MRLLVGMGVKTFSLIVGVKVIIERGSSDYNSS